MPVAAPAADAVLTILEFFGRQHRPVAASHLVDALGMPRSRVYQLLGVLQTRGFVVHLPHERRWALGTAAYELASGYQRHTPLAYLGRAQLARLVARIGESCHLAVRSGTDVVYVVEEAAPRRPSLITDVGVRLPAHITASGRAILAALPREQVRALYPDRSAFASAGVDAAIDSPRTLHEVLRMVRQRGWSEEDGDVTAGFASVAVPVLDHADWPLAAVAVTFQIDSRADAKRAELAVHLARVAAVLSRILGRRDAPDVFGDGRE